MPTSKVKLTLKKSTALSAESGKKKRAADALATQKKKKIVVLAKKRDEKKKTTFANETTEFGEEDDGDDDWWGSGTKKTDDGEDGRNEGSDVDDREDELDEFDDEEDRVDWISDADRKAFKEFYEGLSPDQQRRYEAFRRSKLNHGRIRDLIQNVLAKNVATMKWTIDEKAVVVMAGLAKMFAGDLVENARRIMENRREKGAICPRHLREAYRQVERIGQLPRPGRRRTLRR